MIEQEGKGKTTHRREKKNVSKTRKAECTPVPASYVKKLVSSFHLGVTVTRLSKGIKLSYNTYFFLQAGHKVPPADPANSFTDHSLTPQYYE